MASSDFDPNSVNLTTADPRDVICFLQAGANEYNGNLGARVSALFVILVVSTAATFFPVFSRRTKRFKIPVYMYLFAKYFGAGVIIATAFIQSVITFYFCSLERLMFSA
jgi:zinc transporter 1/2/3